MTELCDFDATTLRNMIGARQATPLEVLDSCIARIEMVNPVLNAMVELCFDAAREDALKRGNLLARCMAFRLRLRKPRTSRGSTAPKDRRFLPM